MRQRGQRQKLARSRAPHTTAVETAATAKVMSMTSTPTNMNGHKTIPTSTAAITRVSRAEETTNPEVATPTTREVSSTNRVQVIFVVPEQTPPAVRLVLGRRPGWMEWNADVHGADEWNFQWRSGRFKPSEYRDAREEQRINHFPRSALITRKDLLLRVLRKMKAVHGEVYAFHPDSYLLPTEYTKFIDEFTRLQSLRSPQSSRQGSRRGATSMDRNGAVSPTSAGEAAGELFTGKSCRNGGANAGDKGALWIVKPSDSSRGRGVYLLRELGELAYDRLSIIQRYISDPLTVGGYKADLRLYVVVTSLHPMTVSVYRNGIVRFATSKYEESPHQALFGHLTNCSINKRSPFVSQEKDVIGGGCKWTLRRLQRWVEESSARGTERWERLWAKIRSLVCLTVLPLADVVPGGAGHSSCFELFGFDVMVDSRLSRPHLIEVNCSPALGLDEPADREVKLPLLSDMLDLVDLESACLAQATSTAARFSRARSMPGFSRPLGYLSPPPSTPSCSPRMHKTELRPPRRPMWLDHHQQQQQQQQKPKQQQQQEQQPNEHPRRQATVPETTTQHAPSPAPASPPALPPPEPLGPPYSTLKAGKIGGSSSLGHGLPPPGFGFELVFPFSAESEDHARRLSNNAGAGKDRESKVQGCIRAIIAEIKVREKRRLVQLKGLSHPRINGNK